MMPTETIYVSLLEENIPVRRPVLAEKVRDGVYRILDQDYDRDIETWEYPPGTEVLCQPIQGSIGPILAAVARA
jgi:hypothetical protein